MRSFALSALFLVIATVSSAQVTLTAYESDGLTPFNSRNIPVGTKLKLVVASDANDVWSGGIFLKDATRTQGALFAYGWKSETYDWRGSHLPDAGSEAYVFDWEDSLIQGFDLFTSPEADAAPGNWFILDYIALEPGEPNITFYDYDVSWNEPNEFIFLHQVPAADFNTDGIVNLFDYSLFSTYWLESDCPDSSECGKVDLDGDGFVDVNDLMLFAEAWMWGIPESSSEGQNSSEPDPNLIYQIVDANGLSSISMAPGESMTLYVDLKTIGVKEVWAFDVEVNISDPNLGSIDNTPYDPNNPPGPGTARILADPNRWVMFDQWGPGHLQPEGIHLTGVGLDVGFEDGHLASFVYTCQSAGDVVLTLHNLDSLSRSGEKLVPTLRNIHIHQNDLLDGESMAMSSMSMTMETSTVPEETTPVVSVEEMVEVLEDIWKTEPDIQDSISKKDWNELIKAVEESYQ